MIVVNVDSSFLHSVRECGAAVIVSDEEGKILSYGMKHMPCAKPSDAEEEAIKLGISHLKHFWPCEWNKRDFSFFSDCMTVVEKMKEMFPDVPITWIGRNYNKIADAYAYEALEYGLTKEEYLEDEQK